MKKIPFGMDLETVFSEYQTTKDGLSNAEAKKRFAQNGANELISKKPKSAWTRFFEQFKDLMLIILIVAAAVTAIIAVVQRQYIDLIDSGIIVGIVLINAIIGFVQETKAIDALAALKSMSAPTARVLRNGRMVEIFAREVVVGDVVCLESGDVVCADCVLIESHSLRSDESSLTGESVEVEKRAGAVLSVGTGVADRINMVHSGCVITYGRGLGVVVATGMDTEMGKIAKMLEGQEPETTPIQQKLKKLGKIITFAVVIIALVMFALNIATGTHTVVEALLLAIALAVAAIPESLPAVITIILSLGVSRMSKKRAIVKKLQAVETLGACGVICTDKTGTLTQNKMTVEAFFANNKIYQGETLAKLRSRHFFNCMVLCNDTIVQGEKLLGDPTETALIAAAQNCGHDASTIREKYARLNELPFDSVRKMMTTLNAVDGEIIAYTKGAPDVILERSCACEINGAVENLTKSIRAEIEAQIANLSEHGWRTLALAYRSKRNENVDENDENRLIFAGIVAMRDPPRSTSREAVREAVAAGILPIMITGDHALTARAIAAEIGIFHEGDKILTGPELDAMSDTDFERILPYVTVYARVSPQNKLRIVSAWKNRGEIVAMTGDGVNDSPSIRAADIGIAMGKTGTEVTKRVSDMVLTDDNFATIVSAVGEGRTIYANIKKVIQFLLGTNLVEVLAIVLISFLYPALGFLTAMQILFVNLITDSLPALALSVEPAERDNMRDPPRAKNEGLFCGIKLPMLVQVVWQTVCVVGCYAVCFELSRDSMLATTMAFCVLSLGQLFHIANVRHSDSLFLSRIFTNKLYWITTFIAVLMIILIVAVPPVAGVFGFVSLSIVQWLVVFGVAFSIIPIMEIYKLCKKIHTKTAKNTEKIAKNQ